MSCIVVRCDNYQYICLPDGADIQKGNRLPCPHNCPYRKTICVKKTGFVIKERLDGEKAHNKKEKGAKSYKGDEISAVLECCAATVDDQPQTDAGSGDINVGRIMESGGSENQVASSKNRENAASKYNLALGNSDKTEEDPVDEQEDNKTLAPRCKTYKFISIGGKIFSDDPDIRRTHGAHRLKNAVFEIFYHWMTQVVFDDRGQLKDEFVWLITSGSRLKILEQEVAEILENQEYNISQKFFYLFYDIIFRHQNDTGFYWCDNSVSTQQLNAVFIDKNDFVAKYCEDSEKGRQFRLFFRNHKTEILHFLKYNEDELYKDMTLIIAKERKQIALIDKHNGEPYLLGTISDFVEKMLIPNAYEISDAMVTFLQTYYIAKDLVVSVRDTAHPFERSSNSNRKFKEDQSMYKAAHLISSSKYASEYDNYATLIKEYVKVFSPDEITIGDLHFTKSDFSAELQDIVRTFCKHHFGDSDDDICQQAKGKAWLAKSIYEREVLSSHFECENEGQIKACLQLLEADQFTLENYMRQFPDPVFTDHGRDLTMRDYIEMILDDEIYSAISRLSNDEKVRIYFERKVTSRDCEQTMKNSFDNYQKQYNDFISNRQGGKE